MVDKVTVFITRQGDNGPEVCVFDHPLAGVQVPAGTLEVGEGFIEGALREAFEETGLEGLRVGAYLGAIDNADALSVDAVRHLVHLVFDGSAADEWFVVTPDGGGLCWRCHWLALHDTGSLVPQQQSWLEVARPELERARHPLAISRPVLDPGVATALSIELFWAPPWSGSRATISWLEPTQAPPDASIHRAEAVAFTDTEDIVAVAEDNEDFRWWSLPGGRREPGERLEETLRRELAEEACADLVDQELVGWQRFRHLSGERVGQVTTDALFWARVELEPFVARFETRDRRCMSVDEACRFQPWANPITQRFLRRAIGRQQWFSRRR